MPWGTSFPQGLRDCCYYVKSSGTAPIHCQIIIVIIIIIIILLLEFSFQLTLECTATFAQDNDNLELLWFPLSLDLSKGCFNFVVWWVKYGWSTFENYSVSYCYDCFFFAKAVF